MKKKTIGILVCMMMLATIPIAAGMNCDISPEPAMTPTGGEKQTFIIGITTEPETGPLGKIISFKVFRGSYRIKGEHLVTVGGLQKLTFLNDFKGIQLQFTFRRYLVIGVFSSLPF